MWLMKMFSERINANAVRNFFKWTWTRIPGETSATVGLLSSVPPEIELSDYQPLPNGDVESPLDLLKGERQKVGPISDLDRFFERLYKYYCEHGLRCIVIRWIGNNVSLGFTIVFSGICLLCVDWHGLITLKCGGPGGDPVECDLAKVAFRKHPLKPFTLYTAVVVGYLGLFSLYWIFCFLIFFVQLKDTLEIRDFYQKSLNITDQELQRMSWSAVLEKTIQFQSIERLCVVKDLSAHDAVMRIMRKDNYLIGMLNKGVLALPIPQWVPGAGPVVHREVNGSENRLILTKTLEWSLKWCILQYMFDRNFLIRKDFINNPGSLRKRLMIVGLLMLVLCPFLGIFMLVYLFLMHAEQFYNRPSTALSRRWSNLAKWLFREFNELEHLFKSRLSGGIEHANDYVRQFPSPVVSLIAKHVSFVAGGLEAILIFIAILEESLLEGQLFGRNLLWYTAVLGAIIAISKSLITEDFQEFDHEGTMALVAQHSHHMPKSWRGAENSEYVRREFEALFQVAETRFASHTIVLRRLVRVKEALCQMVISNKWGGWKQVDTEKAKIVKDLIFSDDFWNRVEYALELTEPLMSMLRYADTDEPCLGNIYDAMDSMLERMKSVIQRREQDPDTLYSTVEKIVLHRWNKMTTPLHLLAYALSPRYYSSEILDIPGRVPPYRDPEVAAGYKRALNRLFSDPDVASNVRREFVDFVSGKFAEPDAINDQSRMDAIGWWYLHGERYMYLQPLAIKILSQYTGVMLFEDMASLFVTPYILIFLLPKQVDAILQFIQDFTMNVEGVGDVCSLSVFDFELHGNSKYGSPCNTSKDRRSGQGKMEKSFLSFKSSYPSWEPNTQGKQFLDTLMDFRQQEQDRQALQMYSPDRFSQKMPSMRGLRSGYSSGLREGVPPRLPLPQPRSVEVQTGQLDQPWTSDMEQKDHLYWLDRYYTLQSLYASDARDNQDCLDALQRNFLAPHTSGRQLVDQRESSGYFGDDRVGNHMEASTSSTFQDSVFRQGTLRQAGHMGESTRWWARRGSQSIRGYESFREPPLFSGGHLEGTNDELSYGSDKEQGVVEQASAVYARNLMNESSASYRSDFIEKNLNALHFPYNNEGRDTIWAMKESSGTYVNDLSDENSGLLFCDVPGRPDHNSQERMRSDSKEIKEE